MSLFDLLPVWDFMALAVVGILVGFGLRMWLHRRGLRQDGVTETREERFTQFVGTLTQSAAIGLALTMVADLLLAARIEDARLLAGLTVLIATVTSFAAAFLRELIRMFFYQ